MSGVKKYDYSTLKQAILDYAEVDDTVFTTTILDGFIMSAEFRIYQDAGMFFAEEDGLACAFLTIVPESLSQKVGRKALARIKKVLGLPAGDESLDLTPVQIYDTASIEDDKLVICVGGVKFGVFGWEEVKKINNAILELRKKLEENGRIVKSVSTH